jgi:hypothetical protein
MWEAKNLDFEEKCFQIFVHHNVQKGAVTKACCVVQYTFCLPGFSAVPEIVTTKEQCVVAERGQMSE